VHESETFLEDRVLPLLQNIEHPDRIAAVVNQVEPEVLFWFLRGSEPMALVALLNACVPSDFECEGALTVLLTELADHRGLVRKKVIPLIERSEAEKMAQIIQGVKAEQLMEVLHRVSLEDLVRLLAHTNAELIVRVFNGPLESTVATVAGITAGALQNPRAAQAINQFTDHLTVGLQQADRLVDDVKAQADKVNKVFDDVKIQADKVNKVFDGVKAHADAVTDKVRDDVSKNIRRGKQERGGAEEDEYQFGDLGRGFIANKADEVSGKVTSIAKLGAQARGGENDDDYKFGDLTRGMVALARDGTQDIADKLKSNSFIQGFQSLRQCDEDVPKKKCIEKTGEQQAVGKDVNSLISLGQNPRETEKTESTSGPNILSSGASASGALAASEHRFEAIGDAFPSGEQAGKSISQVFQNVAQVAQAMRGKSVLNSCSMEHEPGSEHPVKEQEELDFR
jgi:hypothetical protein